MKYLNRYPRDILIAAHINKYNYGVVVNEILESKQKGGARFFSLNKVRMQ